MSKSAVELPDWPQEWQDQTSAGTPAIALDSAAETPPNGTGSLLAGVSMPNWSLATSGPKAFLDPETFADIDFSGTRDGKIPSPSSLDDVRHGRVDASARHDWAQLPPPGDLEAGEHGSGYYTYGTDQTDQPGTAANGQWGTPRTMEVIGAAADRLATGDQYTPFGVGNISLERGGKFLGHSGHMDGLGIDVRPARTDGAQLPVTYQSPQYDQAATQRLVDAFRATGQVDKIFFNDPRINGVQPSERHDNHFHVQLKR